jgi:serine/threonine-protein phosphatase 2A regulatory subunit A
VSGKVPPKYLNEKLIPYVLKLADDPVPNIRFNVAKLVEAIYPRLSPSNKMRGEDALKKMIDNEKGDFDVKYFAERAYSNITQTDTQESPDHL